MRSLDLSGAAEAHAARDAEMQRVARAAEREVRDVLDRVTVRVEREIQREVRTRARAAHQPWVSIYVYVSVSRGRVFCVKVRVKNVLHCLTVGYTFVYTALLRITATWASPLTGGPPVRWLVICSGFAEAREARRASARIVNTRRWRKPTRGPPTV